MNTPKEIIGHISGGRVLDVATGSGGFIHFLLDGLKDYNEIIGIDTNERGAATFVEAFKDNPNIHFQGIDALHTNFADEAFDTVCIANSLHHFEEPMAILIEMKRLLRFRGTFIIAEMYCDGQTETQMTHVHLHHWWAAVDTANGITHHETYQRDQIVKLVTQVGLCDLAQHNLADLDEDAKNPEILAQLNPAIDRYIQRAEGHPDLQAQGEILRQRVQKIGFHGATSLILVGKKQGN